MGLRHRPVRSNDPTRREHCDVHLGAASERGEITEILPDRATTPNEMRALVAASGRFEIVTELGSIDVNVPFSNAKESWRYVPVLRRL